ncbi:MAG: hypothetical protein N0E48_18155 [Candidatus Thiodiazotropha endolucinida]|nr:hypothetical protein [Candidatus Thiodiazotropha endolucinida]
MENRPGDRIRNAWVVREVYLGRRCQATFLIAYCAITQATL